MSAETDVILREGCRRFGIDPADLTQLNGSDVFSMDISTRPVFQFREGEQAYVLKFVEYPREQFISTCEIVEFVDYLAEGGAQVCRPLPSLENHLVEGIQKNGHIVAVTKTSKVNGEHVFGESEKINAAFFREWGRTVGQLHSLSKGYAGGLHIGTWETEINDLAGLSEDQGVIDRWHEVGLGFQALPQPPDAFGLIHNDLHPENFLVDQGRIIVMDFDVCRRHWFILDVAMAVYFAAVGMIKSPDKNLQGEAFTRHFFETFMQGYEQKNHLDSFWIHQMPLFFKHRLILPYLLYEKGMIERKDPGRDSWRKAILDNYPVARPEIWQEY